MAITSLSILFGSIFLNDGFKLFIYVTDNIKRYLRRRKHERERAKHEEQERNTRQSIIELDRIYNEELEQKLERFHQALIRVHIENKRREN